MFVQIVITKVGEDDYKIVLFDEQSVLHSETMNYIDAVNMVWLNMTKLRPSNAQPPQAPL